MPGDITNANVISEIVSQTSSNFNRLDALVNNAGAINVNTVETCR